MKIGFYGLNCEKYSVRNRVSLALTLGEKIYNILIAKMVKAPNFFLQEKYLRYRLSHIKLEKCVLYKYVTNQM
jgi:hypothetical protein